jgi:phosphatidylglycerophosphate synthase
MFSSAARVYRETRKKHDQVFNVYVMRPVAAVFVAAVARTSVTPNQVTLLNLAVFVGCAAMLVALPSWWGGVASVAVLELSYCLDCADGMLARFKHLASKEGHLFDFFTDELKAVLLVGALAVRAWRAGGMGYEGTAWAAGDARFLLAGIAGVTVVASAVSLTSFVRRPEISGRATTVEAHYEAAQPKAVSGAARGASLVATFLRFANHYPSHIWLWALVGRMDVYFWVWIALNAVYLARGWIGLVLRFGRG